MYEQRDGLDPDRRERCPPTQRIERVRKPLDGEAARPRLREPHGRSTSSTSAKGAASLDIAPPCSCATARADPRRSAVKSREIFLNIVLPMVLRPAERIRAPYFLWTAWRVTFTPRPTRAHDQPISIRARRHAAARAIGSSRIATTARRPSFGFEQRLHFRVARHVSNFSYTSRGSPIA